ncbi:MAG: hypothetical protein AB2535_16730 [Candidatus Thiodiazotropha endolucinida]
MEMRVVQVAFYTGPHTNGAPYNLETVNLDFIDRVQKCQRNAVQVLKREPTAKAIIITARQHLMLVKPVVELRLTKGIA